jgi:predicted MFS family arabinose efflux permease
MANLGFAMVGTLVAVWIWERSGHRMAILLGALLMAVSMFTIPFTRDVPVLIATQVFCGLGRGILLTSLMTLSIRDVAPKHQATAMGIYQAVYAVGMLAGPLVSGFLGDSLGLDSIFFLTALLSSFIMVLAFLPAFSRK